MQNNKVSNLKNAISTERLENCKISLVDENGISFDVLDEGHLYELYLYNEMLSKEIRYILSQFEILLRNNINKAIIPSRGNNWIIDLKKQGFWDQKTVEQIEKAEHRLKELKKTISHERILAKLTLGFWLRLFNNPYFEPLIRDELKTIFPRNKQGLTGRTYGISDFREKLKFLHDIRNKVSHQEFILAPKYKIKTNYDEAILLMKMMNEEYYSYFESEDHFKTIFEKFYEFVTKLKKEHKDVIQKIAGDNS